MKRLLPKRLNVKYKSVFKASSLLFLTFYAFLVIISQQALAQLNNYSGSLRVGAGATAGAVGVGGVVGQYYLNLAGYISPFSSVTLISGGVVLRSTISDQYGDFSISGVLIKRGFSAFCLRAVDFRNIGQSLTCFNIAPATASVTMKDIFLPPTLALYKNEIPQQGSTLAFGYTMPGALVTLYISNGRELTTYADSLGYYRFVIKNLKAGKYSIWAKAEYKNKESESPSINLVLTALSPWQQFLLLLRELWQNFLVFLTSLSLGPLWLVVPIIILIIILIYKLWGPKLRSIQGIKSPFIFPKLFGRNRHPLHHAWEFGY